MLSRLGVVRVSHFALVRAGYRHYRRKRSFAQIKQFDLALTWLGQGLKLLATRNVVKLSAPSY